MWLTRIESKIDVGEKTHSDDLPQKTEDQVLSGFEKILSSNIDNGATDGRGGVNGKVEIFLFSVNTLY